eukprot:365795-Chlamydomonas_euryale.AAC.8
MASRRPSGGLEALHPALNASEALHPAVNASEALHPALNASEALNPALNASEALRPAASRAPCRRSLEPCLERLRSLAPCRTPCAAPQVLGRSEFKQLLRWRLALRKALKVQGLVDVEDAKPKVRACFGCVGRMWEMPSQRCVPALAVWGGCGRCQAKGARLLWLCGADVGDADSRSKSSFQSTPPAPVPTPRAATPRSPPTQPARAPTAAASLRTPMRRCCVRWRRPRRGSRRALSARRSTGAK